MICKIIGNNYIVLPSADVFTESMSVVYPDFINISKISLNERKKLKDKFDSWHFIMNIRNPVVYLDISHENKLIK